MHESKRNHFRPSRAFHLLRHFTQGSRPGLLAIAPPGLGVRSFSMNASAVPRVKQAVRGLNTDDCFRFARKVMEQSDPTRIHDLVWGGPRKE